MLEKGEFKGATVLAGSVLEALLLDAIEQFTEDQRSEAIAAWQLDCQRRGEKVPKPANDLDRWTLNELTCVALFATVISDEVARHIHLARDFRNLSHPGKTRLRLPADEGTAFAAIGACSRLAAHLEKRARVAETKPAAIKDLARAGDYSSTNPSVTDEVIT
jgi:hypothetical protein